MKPQQIETAVEVSSKTVHILPIQLCTGRCYVGAIEPENGEMPVRVSDLLVTETDVWVGTEQEGLFRYDRLTREWRSYRKGGIGNRVTGLWQEGSRIWVGHGVVGNHAYFYEHFTEDRGKTWTCFSMGDGSSGDVHAPRFTNRGCRTERLQRITDALLKGDRPEELTGHIRIGGEVYFTVYVNSSDGWCALYSYDVAEDRLTDLGISERDPGAVGVRSFHLDPHENRFLWILSADYGGAVQLPRKWFRYDRTTREMTDTGIRHQGDKAYVVDPQADEPYRQLVRFLPDKVLFLGEKKDGSLGVIAEYNRRSDEYTDSTD